jgi:hypothetical protein
VTEPLPRRPRFAGFEIGSTKLAAFATNAHASTYGSGSAFALRIAAATAGVRTTAVASFESTIVTSTPTP